jgi:hypothetical protein
MQETNATCMGPTGFLYCGGNGFSLEPNSTWQVATPGHPKPSPINAPTPHFTIDAASWALRIDPRQMITLSDVNTVEVTRAGRSLIFLQGDAARGLLTLIDFAHPFQIDGVLGAIVTGELTIAHSKGESRFLIYNNRLLVQEGAPPTYYNCSEGFAHALTVGIR